MAKLINGFAPRPGQAQRGRAIVYVQHGQTVIAPWPNRQPKTVSPRQLAAIDRFREAAYVIKRSDAFQQSEAAKLSEGTQMLPRDLQMQALYGRMGTYIELNGQRWYSVAAHNDVSEVLDALSYEPGTILFRGANWWTPIAPGSDGDVLIWVEGLPRWGSGEALAGGHFFGVTASTWGTVSVAANATKGIYFQPREEVQIEAAWMFVDPNAVDDIYRFQLAEVTGFGASDTIVALLGTTFEGVPGITTGVSFRLPFPDPILCLPEKKYVLASQRVGGTGTSANRTYLVGLTNNFWDWNGPIQTEFPAPVFNQTTLAPGQTRDSATGSSKYAVWVEGKIGA